jgi:hypothetical protein
LIPARFNPRDLALFARALPLARRAQRVRSHGLREVVASMAAGSRGLRHHPKRRLLEAAIRANLRWCRWFGGIDTCLTRSLVIGGMLAHRDDVVLKIGFGAGDDDSPLHGHAWITVAGKPVGSDGELAEGTYRQVLAIPFRGRKGAR